MLWTDYLVAEVQKSKNDLKHRYRKRMNQKKSTRWPELLGTTLYVDVTIVRAKCLSERFREEHAMGLVDRGDHSYVTVDELLKDEHGKVILIEGDPGAGKTTFTFQICKEWAEDKLLMEDIVLWIPLRHYKSVTTTSELFDKLGYPEIMEYAQKRGGKGFVLILDGWDELPNHLQTASLFRDIIFSKIRIFGQSTIIVTSRPSCSGEIAVAVEETNSYYQILGFDQEKAVTYINKYFHNDSTSAKSLLAFLNSNEYFYRHFYIPVSVTIMCFVYRSDREQIPQTLSRLYERFVVICLRSNIPNTSSQDLAKFEAIHDIPGTMRPAFHRLCKIAFDMLRDSKLVLNEDELEKTDNLQLKQLDGFGLLHIDHYTSTLATIATSYSFIHRAVQELLAAIFILDTGNISDILDEYFYVGSYLMNMFLFLFGLVSKEFHTSLVGKLRQIFNKYDRDDELLSSILYCLFEAHDETFCREFGQVFNKKRDVNFFLRAFLECHYYYYFLSVCGGKKLNVSVTHKFALPATDDLCFKVMATYLSKASINISSFTCIIDTLSQTGMEQFVNVLANQNNLHTVKVDCNSCPPGCIKILCDSILKHNCQITSLTLPKSVLSTSDLESIGSVIAVLSLEKLHLTSYSPDDGDFCDIMCSHLNLSGSFCKALCKTKSLQKLWLPSLNLSQVDSKVFGNVISKNCSLKELCINVATADCMDPILNGLSSNTSITTFRAWPSKAGASNSLGQCLEKCLTSNGTVKNVDFTASSFREPSMYLSWSSAQVCSICAGPCANTTVVTLDISGCCTDTEACHAVCGMLSQNTTLQHLFLNPVQLDKQEAITMIESCRDNDTLKLLSLVQWPPKRWSSDDKGKDPFQYSCNPEVNHVLLTIQKLRQERDKPLLNVYWLVSAVVISFIVDYFVYTCCRKWDEYKKVKNRRF